MSSYVKANWTDRVVQFPRRYRDESNNQKTFTPDEGTITNSGTPITAGAMNNIENRLSIATAVVAGCVEYAPTDTASHTLFTFTPIVSGCFDLKSYIRGGACNITLTLTWTAANGAQTLKILDNFYVQADSYPLDSVFFYAIAGQPITLTAQISIASFIAFTHKLVEV